VIHVNIKYKKRLIITDQPFSRKEIKHHEGVSDVLTYYEQKGVKDTAFHEYTI